MIIQLMGPQACGKGTQGEMLSKKFGLPLIGMGDLFRDLPEGHPLHKQVNDQMGRGILVDHHITAKLLKERISQSDCANGYILDGYTRALVQLTYFDPHPDYVIYLNIPRKETLKRITGRRICETDGKNYNINTMSPEELKKCTGKLIQREDDKEEAVNQRLDIFDHETMEVIKKYRKDGILLEIDGMGTPDEVFGRVLTALEVSEKMKLGYNN